MRLSIDLVHGPSLRRVLIEAALHGEGGKDVRLPQVAVRPFRCVRRPSPANCAVLIVQPRTSDSALGPCTLLGSLQGTLYIIDIRDIIATPGSSSSRMTQSPRGRQTGCPSLCCAEPGTRLNSTPAQCTRHRAQGQIAQEVTGHRAQG